MRLWGPLVVDLSNEVSASVARIGTRLVFVDAPGYQVQLHNLRQKVRLGPLRSNTSLTAPATRLGTHRRDRLKKGFKVMRTSAREGEATHHKAFELLGVAALILGTVTTIDADSTASSIIRRTRFFCVSRAGASSLGRVPHPLSSHTELAHAPPVTFDCRMLSHCLPSAAWSRRQVFRSVGSGGGEYLKHETVQYTNHRLRPCAVVVIALGFVGVAVAVVCFSVRPGATI